MRVEKLLNGIVWTNILIVLFIELLKCYLPMAEIINYVPDLLNAAMVVILLKEAVEKKRPLQFGWDLRAAALFLAWVLITCFFPAGGLIDRYRRLRYIVFAFIAYYVTRQYISKDNWSKLIQLLFGIQIIHTILVFYQFFVLETRADMTNGIFGFLQYNNAPQGLFCLILSIIGLEYYLKKKLPLWQCFAMILLSCVTCAMAEIKAYFVLLVMASILVIGLNTFWRGSFRRIATCALVVGVGLVGAYLIMKVTLPDNLYAFGSVDNWVLYESYETNRADGLGRLTQISWLYENEFDRNFLGALVGKGVGYDTSVVVYELGKLFLNFGFVGLVLFGLFLLLSAIRLLKRTKTQPEATVSVVMLALIAPMVLVWNTTLNRMSMLLFVVLAIGAAQPRLDQEEDPSK